MATKVEAYLDRGKNDPLGSHDFEDIVYVLASRRDFIERLREAPEDLQSYLRTSLPPIMTSRQGKIGIEGALAYHAEGAMDHVLDLLKQIAAL